MWTKNGKDTSVRYDQTKRVIDKFLKDLRNRKEINWNLETCNMNAAACLVEATGNSFKATLPRVDNRNLISQADLFVDICYTDPDIPVKSDTECENEFPENITYVINKLSTAKATLITFKNINDMTAAIKNVLNKGHGIELSYKTDYGGGHYIALVGIEGDKIFAYDSWGANKHCKNNGVLEEYSISFFKERCKDRLRFIEVE